MSSEGSSSQPKPRGASLWSSGLPMSVYYCPSEGPAESLEPVASPGPNSGKPASGGRRSPVHFGGTGTGQSLCISDHPRPHFQ